MSGHALYRTIAVILILNVSFASLPFLAGLALLPVRIAATRMVPQERAVVATGPGCWEARTRPHRCACS